MRVATLLLLLSLPRGTGKIDVLNKRRSVGIFVDGGSKDALDKLRHVREKTAEGVVLDIAEGKAKPKKTYAGTTVAAAKPPPEVWEAAVVPPSAIEIDRATLVAESVSKEVESSRSKLRDVAFKLSEKSGPISLGGALGQHPSRDLCYPCPRTSQADPVRASIQHFWSNDLLEANACACSVLKWKLDAAVAGIVRAVYVATQKYVQSLAVPGFGPDLPEVELRSIASPFVSQWEILAPFPSSQQGFDADIVMAQLFRLSEFQGEEETQSRQKDIFASMMKMSAEVKFPSELAEEGFLRWTSILSSLDSGHVEVKFPWIRWSLSTPGVLQFQGWARGVTFAARSGPHVLTCRGFSILYIRNDNMTRIASADPSMRVRSGLPSVVSSIELKAGPVGILAPFSGSAVAHFSCSLVHSVAYTSLYQGSPSAGDSGAIVGTTGVIREGSVSTSKPDASPATHNSASVSGRSSVGNSKKGAGGGHSDQKAGRGSGAVLVIQTPMHLSSALLEYPSSPPAEVIRKPGNSPQRHDWGLADGAVGIGGKGLLLSRFFSLPILNTDSRSTSVRLELDGQQHMLHRYSVRVAKPIPANGDSGNKAASYYSESRSLGLLSEEDSESASSEGWQDGRDIGSRVSYNIGADSSDETLELPPGQLIMVPLELYVVDTQTGGSSTSENDDEIHLTCRKQAGGRAAGSLTLSIIPARGASSKIPLTFPCKRLNETLSFSFQTTQGGVSSAVVIAPLLPLPGEQYRRGQDVRSEDKSSNVDNSLHLSSKANSGKPEVVSIRGKGVAARGSSSASRGDRAPRGTEAGKRFEALRSADSTHYSSSTAARLLAEREDSDDTGSPAAYNLLDRDTVGKENLVSTALPVNPSPMELFPDSDLAVPKSQFYVHREKKMDGQPLLQGEEHIYLQYTGNDKIAYLVSGPDSYFTPEDVSIFPVLVTLHGQVSTAMELAESYRVIAKSGVWGRGKATDNLAPRLGVEGFWLLVPQLGDCDMLLSVDTAVIEDAVSGLDKLTRRLHRLPPVWTSTGRLLMGHGVGAHAAVLAALHRPGSVACLAPLSLSFIRKENLADVGSYDAFFRTDAPYMSPALSALLSRAAVSQQVDRLVGNGFAFNIHVRVGSKDTISHPWVSKRIYRQFHEALLTRAGVLDMDPTAHSNKDASSRLADKFNSACDSQLVLDIVRGHGHWWNDSASSGDGGITNDATIREFYAKCRTRSIADVISSAEFRRRQEAVTGTPDAASAEGVTINTSQIRQEARLDDGHRHCSEASYSIILYSPSESECYCGVCVTQQARSLERSDVLVKTEILPRRQLIMRAIREVNLQSKAKSTGDYFEDFELNEKEMVYFDMAAEASDLSADEADRNWVAIRAGKRKGTPSAFESSRNDEDTAVSMKRSVRQKILQHPEMDGLFTLPTHVSYGNLCIIRTNNVRRMRLMNVLHQSCRGNSSFSSIRTGGNASLSPTLVIVDGRIVRPPRVGTSAFTAAIFEVNYPVVDLCWNSKRPSLFDWRDSTVYICSHPMNPLTEKAVLASGSMRSLLSRPIVIIFGTPSNLDLRQVLRDMAVRIASTIAASTGIYVHLFSDFEYRDRVNGDVETSIMSGSENLIFIGGPESNKIMREVVDMTLLGSSTSTAFHLPVSFLKQQQGFSVGPHRFDASDHGILFLFPAATALKASSPWPAQFFVDENVEHFTEVRPSLAMCVAANSLSGYHHTTRLLQSSDGPFQLAIPDFVVTSARVWSHGMAGGSPLLGFWNATWGFDQSQSYYGADADAFRD